MNCKLVFRFGTGVACASFLIGLLLTPPAQAARPLGIDTSTYNGLNIDWTAVYSQGYTFAFTRSSYGTSYTDDTLATNMFKAKAAGLLIGPYHFAYPAVNTGTAGATAEANHFVAAAGKYMISGYLPPVLDLETGSSGLSSWANTFCNRVKTLTGVSPVIYTGQSFAATYLDSSVTNWDVWIAQWPCNSCVWPCTSCIGNTQTGNPSATPWKRWTFWQNQGEASGMPGVPSTTDLDTFNGTLAELQSYVIGGVANTPPSITLQPVNQNVVAGGTANFTVGATGSGLLSYGWQKNNANLSNGGHYSGCTTVTLTITGVDNSDVANYRCVVTNAYGSMNSSAASLTIAVGCAPGVLVNADFEGGNTGGVATGWTGYQRAPNPTTAWTIQIASPPTGGGLQYQQIANTSSTGGGGVRQDVTGCIVGATYTISGWMRGNSASATCRVKCSPSVSTDWSTAGDLNPPQSFSGTNWVTFSGTMVATGTTMTLWLDGQTSGSGLNKAECFDSVTITCAGGVAPPVLDGQRQGNNLVFSWPTNFAGYTLTAATNLGAGAVWSTVSPSPAVVNGMNVVTNAMSSQRKFYRLMHP